MKEENTIVIVITGSYREARSYAESAGLPPEAWWQFGSFLAAFAWLKRCADRGSIRWDQDSPPTGVEWKYLR